MINIMVQTKDRVLNCEDILIQDNKIMANKGDCMVTLGVYEDNDRAMKVLSNITRYIISKNRTDEIIGNKRIYGDTVFVMPEK